MIAGALFDSDEMIRKAFEISVKAVNIHATEHAKGVLLTPETKIINKNAFQVANIGMHRFFKYKSSYFLLFKVLIYI